MEDTFFDTFSRLVKESGRSQAEIVRHTNEQIAQAHVEERYTALAMMISPVSEAMLSYALNGKRNIGAQELRKICYFGLGLSSEQCDQLEVLRKRDRITQADLPVVPKSDTDIPVLPEWICEEAK